MNKVLLVGRLTKEVVVMSSTSNKEYSFNTIAVKRDYKNKDGKYDSDYINLTFAEPTTTFLKNYVAKGDLIEIDGKWRNKKDKDNHNVDYVQVESISILVKAQTSVEEDKEEKQVPSSELPF